MTARLDRGLGFDPASVGRRLVALSDQRKILRALRILEGQELVRAQEFDPVFPGQVGKLSPKLCMRRARAERRGEDVTGYPARVRCLDREPEGLT